MTLPLSPPGETPRAEHWRSMLAKVGGWDNEPAAVPAGGVRKLIEEFGALERELRQAQEERDLAIAHDRQSYPTAAAYEAVCAALRQAQERCEKLEQTISLAFLQLTMPSKFKYGAAKKTLMDAAASGPKEQKHNLKEDL